MARRRVSRLVLHAPVLLLLSSLAALAGPSSADPIFGARVSHMTVPQRSDDPKLSVAYWPYQEGKKLPPLEPGQQVMQLTDGVTQRRHLCIIPNTSAAGALAAGADLDDPMPDAAGAGQQGLGLQGGVGERDSRRSPEELLDAMKGLPCSYRMEGWWTYEFCYKDKIRQLHIEPAPENKLQITTEFVLGKYDEAASRAAQQQLAAKWAHMSPEERITRKRYHVEVYTGGTPCDLTGELRQSEVRYFCEDDGSEQDEPGQQQQQQQKQKEEQAQPFASILKSIKEGPTCQYEVHFVAHALCSHRGFRKAKQPVNVINCYELEPVEGQGEEGAAGNGKQPQTAFPSQGVGVESAPKGESKGSAKGASAAEEVEGGGGTGGLEGEGAGDEGEEDEAEEEESEGHWVLEDGEVKAIEEDLFEL